MSKGFYQMPYPVNEEVRSYEPNSKELENIHFPDLSRIVDEVTKFYLNEK